MLWVGLDVGEDSSSLGQRLLWPALVTMIAALFIGVVLRVESEPAFIESAHPIRSLPAATFSGKSLDGLAREPIVAVLVWMPG